MLEQIDLSRALPKDEYRQQLPALRQRLYELEHGLFKANVPVIVLFEGWATAEKGGTINVLTERLDARGFRMVMVSPPRTHEMRFPWLWRFWQQVPAYGQMVIYDSSWYRRVLIERIAKTVSRHDWERAYYDINEFEEQLAADGTVIVKFWLHISKKEQAKRMKALLNDPLTAWQVSDEEILQHKKYNKYFESVEEMLARTDTPYAPWTIVEAMDRYYARVKVYKTLIAAIETRIGEPSSLKLPHPSSYNHEE